MEKMSAYFQNKNIVITGASKGIGFELVNSLLKKGANVAGIARTKNLLDEIEKKAEELPGSFHGLECDVTDYGSVSRTMESVLKKFGTIDILINNAGGALVGPLLDTKKEEMEKCFNLNFFSAVYCTEKIAPAMIEKKTGIIINVASVVARYGLPTCGYYSAAKAAMANYTQALSTELAPAGVKVIVVYPGNTDTGFHKTMAKTEGFNPSYKKKGQMSPKHVADKILNAAQNKKLEVTLGFAGKIMLLMKNLVPSFLQNILVKEFNISDWYTQKSSASLKKNNFIDDSVNANSNLLALDKPCHYHTKSEELGNGLLPKGLSPSLYYYMYPYLLSTAYGGKIASEQGFKNPLNDTSIVAKEKAFIIKNPPPIIEQGKNVIKDILSPFRKYGKILNGPKIVTEEGTFPFDLGYDRTSCPAAFRSQFPTLARHAIADKQNNTKTPWKAGCPDHIKNLVFGDTQGDENLQLDDSDAICYWGEDAKIESVSGCFKGSQHEVPITLDEIMKKLDFPCPMFLNTLYGYYVTLVKGGKMAFYSKRLEAVVAQCPSTKSRVAMEVSLNGDQVDFDTIEVNGSECPRGIKVGDRFSLPADPEKNAICLEAFNSIFLACGVAEFSEKPLNVGCVLENCNACWQVSAPSKVNSIEPTV
jgi:uncharacterized protein